MVWVKLDDGFFRHPKIVRAGRDARDLYLAALCYAQSGLTDGFIHADALRRLAADAEVDDPRALAERLVEVGLWERVEGGFQVHDYLDYNPPAEKVRREREAAAERRRRPRPAEPSDDGGRSPERRQNVRPDSGQRSASPDPVPDPAVHPSPNLDPAGAAEPAGRPGARAREAASAIVSSLEERLGIARDEGLLAELLEEFPELDAGALHGEIVAAATKRVRGKPWTLGDWRAWLLARPRRKEAANGTHASAGAFAGIGRRSDQLGL